MAVTLQSIMSVIPTYYDKLPNVPVILTPSRARYWVGHAHCGLNPPGPGSWYRAATRGGLWTFDRGHTPLPGDDQKMPPRGLYHTYQVLTAWAAQRRSQSGYTHELAEMLRYAWERHHRVFASATGEPLYCVFEKPGVTTVLVDKPVPLGRKYACTCSPQCLPAGSYVFYEYEYVPRHLRAAFEKKRAAEALAWLKAFGPRDRP